ncbi:MAG: hypothetical protein BWX70_01844 [Verrucomicrobia bacterium ADurb.Bin070]|nr:MAG: hypothetical protein BWX70_01844 [Verrucomicrobia bacterium ADurb.Bin070]
MLVVELHAVAVQPVLHAHAVVPDTGPGEDVGVGQRVGLPVRAHRPAEVAQHALARAVREFVAQEAVHQRRDRPRRVEDEVRRPFALPQRPAVARPAAERLAHRRESLAGEPVQDAEPRGERLRVEEPLRRREVADGEELVPVNGVRHTLQLQPPAEPLPPVEGDLDLVREPGLQPHTHEAVHRVVVVEVQVLALAVLRAQPRASRAGVERRAECPARLRAGPHADRPASHAL